MITYERTWHLDTEVDQADLAWLFVYKLRPKVVHLGTPCTKMSKIGSKELDDESRRQNRFTLQVCEHQEKQRLHALLEGGPALPRVEQTRTQTVLPGNVNPRGLL